MTTSAIEISNITKTYGKKRALSDINLSIEQGEFVALIGPSGSGKSTLLRHASGLVTADKGEGEIRILGKSVQKLGRLSPKIRETRADVGFIFQQFNLVSRMTLLDNVLTGMLNRVPAWRSITRLVTKNEKQSAMESLYCVGLHEHAGQRASTLSGGQQQRAAIARTMEQRAKIILADEPIASLDPESARMVMDCLAELNRDEKVTIVISLHQVQFALQYCPRSIAMKDGQVVYDGPSSELTAEVLREIYGTSSAETLDGTAPLAEMRKRLREAGLKPRQRPVTPGLAQIGALSR